MTAPGSAAPKTALPATITLAPAVAAMPMVADAWKRRDMPLLGELYSRSSLVQTLISGFLFLLMWMSMDDLFTILPSEYAGGVQVAWIIGMAYLLNGMMGLSMSLLSMSRSYRLDAWSSFGMLLVNAVANFFLILGHAGLVLFFLQFDQLGLHVLLHARDLAHVRHQLIFRPRIQRFGHHVGHFLPDLLLLFAAPVAEVGIGIHQSHDAVPDLLR